MIVSSFRIYNPDMVLTSSLKNCLNILKKTNTPYTRIKGGYIQFAAEIFNTKARVLVKLHYFFFKIDYIKIYRPIKNIYDYDASFKEFSNLLIEEFGAPKKSPSKYILEQDWEYKRFAINHCFNDRFEEDEAIYIRFNTKKINSKHLLFRICMEGGFASGIMLFLLMGIKYGHTLKLLGLSMAAGLFFGTSMLIIMLLLLGSSMNFRTHINTKLLNTYEKSLTEKQSVIINCFIELNKKSVSEAKIFFFENHLLISAVYFNKLKLLKYNYSDITSRIYDYSGIINTIENHYNIRFNDYLDAELFFAEYQKKKGN